jgi:hypothetical protein
VAGVAQFLQARFGDLFRYQYTRHRFTFRLTHPE